MSCETRSLTVKTGSLLLDSKNTRIPSDRRSDDQRRLIQELLEKEDVKELAASIAKLGLFPNERLLVLATDRHYVVLEGNRRLAAIKLLLNPGLAPTDALVSYFRKLSDRANLSELATLEVTVYPTRISAAPVISALHIGDSKKHWSSLQQARFYRELVDEGLTPEGIAERESGVTLGQVRAFLRSEQLHRVALTLDIDEDTRNKVDDSRFPLTTLDRFVDSKTGRKFLGIEFDDSQGFKGVVHPERFKAVLAHVVKDIVNVKSITRKINSEDDFKRYVAEAETLIPKTPKQGSFSPSSLLGEDQSGNQNPNIGAALQPTTLKRTIKPSPSVIPRGFQCNSKSDRVRAVFTELKSMRIAEQRNSTGVMLRVLLDIALWHFLDSERHTQSVCSHFDKDGKKKKYDANWTPPLRDLISYAVEHTLFPGMDASGYKSVRTLVARDADYFITIEGFNAFTHNPYVTPTEGDLRALWQRAEPMLEIILNV
jgi:hypothetical protein